MGEWGLIERLALTALAGAHSAALRHSWSTVSRETGGRHGGFPQLVRTEDARPERLGSRFEENPSPRSAYVLAAELRRRSM